MQESKLVEIFKKFVGKDWVRLRKFVQSPYHNQREDVGRLLEFMIKQTQSKQAVWSRYKAWAYCYPDKKQYDDGTMRCLMTFLLQIIEEFLKVEQLGQDVAQEHLYLAKAYHHLQLAIPAQQNLDKLSQHLEKQPQRNSQYLRQCYEEQQAQHYFTETLHRDAPRNLQLWADTLEYQFIAEKLKQTCELLAHQTVYKIQYDWGVLPMLLEYIQQKETTLLKQPAIALYYYYYQAATQQDTILGEHYFGLYTKLLLQSIIHFPKNELRDLYKMALNYTIRKANTDYNEYYMQQMFVLYESGLEHSILLENTQLSRFAYKNIVSMGLHLEKYEWTANFIEQYTHLLLPLYQKSYKYYAQGKFYFAKHEYTKALEYLQHVEYEDIFLNLGARVIQLKIYYELGEYDALDSFLQSFKVFVLRKKRVLGYHYDNFKNIIQCIRRLMNLPSQSKKKKMQLQDKVKSIATLTERDWLLKQLKK